MDVVRRKQIAKRALTDLGKREWELAEKATERMKE